MAEEQRVAAKVCGVCGHVLHRLRHDGTEDWLHARELTSGTDHPTVPVDYDETNLVSTCDFCNDNVPLDERWYLAAQDFEVLIVEGLKHVSRGGWNCCSGCAPHVAASDWRTIIERHMAKNGSNYGATLAPFFRTTFLPVLYSALERHTLAPLRPWRAGDELSLPS